MGWSGTFRNKLAAGGRPTFSVEIVSAPLLGGLFSATPPSFDSLTAAGATAVLSATGFSYSSGRLDPQRWVVTGGGASIDVALTAADGATIANLRRGQLVSLKATLSGTTERIWSGVLRNVTSSGDTLQRVTLVCDALDYALTTRLVHSRSDLRLFEDLVSGGTRTQGLIDTTWNPGDATMVLKSTSGDWTQFETGGWLCAMVDVGGTAGTPGSGTPFYIRGTSYTGGTLTIGGIYAGDIMGTTRATAVSNTPVYLVPSVNQDDPVHAAFKVITSTGAGTNGSYDTLPIESGCGFPSALIDGGDINQQSAMVVDSGGTQILVDVFEAYNPRDNPRQWLQSMLAPMGIALVQRQGLLTCRIAQDPASVGSGTTSFAINDSNLQKLLRHDAFAPGYLEAPDVTWEDASGNEGGYSSTLVSSLPVRSPQTYSVPFLYAATNAAVAGVADRWGPWIEVCPESVKARTAGLAASELCPGDLPNWQVSSRYLRSLRAGGLGASNQRTLVLSVAVSWWGGSLHTDVELLASPEAGS